MNALPARRRSRAASFGIWLLLYSIALVLLNVLIKTDSPRQPGDGWRALGKVYIAVCLAWLLMRWNDRIERWREANRRRRGSIDGRYALPTEVGQPGCPACPVIRD
jgi:hypothetical protein